MSYTANPSQEYLKNAVLTASAEQLQLMLYDGAIRFTSQGSQAMQAGDREGVLNALERAQAIVIELGNGLRPEINEDLANRMRSVYDFIYRRLVDANINQDAEALGDALRILRYQRETWTLLMNKTQAELQATTPAATATPPEQSDQGEPDREPVSFDTRG